MLFLERNLLYCCSENNHYVSFGIANVAFGMIFCLALQRRCLTLSVCRQMIQNVTDKDTNIMQLEKSASVLACARLHVWYIFQTDGACAHTCKHACKVQPLKNHTCTHAYRQGYSLRPDGINWRVAWKIHDPQDLVASVMSSCLVALLLMAGVMHWYDMATWLWQSNECFAMTCEKVWSQVLHTVVYKCMFVHICFYNSYVCVTYMQSVIAVPITQSHKTED
jgi:hypothetical protein